MVEQRVAQAPQHALAQPALHGVDLELQPAVHHDQREEGEGERDQVGQLVQREAVEQVQRAAAEKCRQREVDFQERDRRGRLREALALDRLVDDGLGQVEHREVDQHRCDHQRQDQQLLALAVAQDEAEQRPFHGEGS